ncbi:helix-turn-helix domain-containing protein [Lacticaseibacillus sp. N501-2]|uniref:helix-turn-helix domain-containing protein n=1 Tax=Lacticaseibacillus salsurae TaxID=3367729 RepID=UPI0038B27002
MSTAEILQIRRKAVGWTQAQLAEAIGVSVKTVSNWENGRTMPDIQSLIRLSRLYGLSLDELLTEGSDLVKHMQQDETLVREATWGMLGPQLTNTILMMMWIGPFFFKSWRLAEPMFYLLFLAIIGNAAANYYFMRRQKAAQVKISVSRPWRFLKALQLILFAIVFIAVMIHRTMIGW